MQRALSTLLFVSLYLNGDSILAQPAVERLEKKLKQQPALGKAPGDAPQVEPKEAAPLEGAELPPPAEPGYAGMDIDDSDEEGAGVRITRIDVQGPAERGGLEFGDLIVAIDGAPVNTTEAAVDALSKAHAGQVVAFDVERPERDGGARSLIVEITLGKRPARRTGAVALGVRAERVTQADLPILNLNEARGALVVEVMPGSPAEQADVPVDAVIVTFDGQPVDGPSDLARYLGVAKPGERARLGYWFDGQLEETEVVLAPAAARPARKAPVEKAAPQGAPKPLEDEPAAATKIAELENKIRELEARIAALEAKTQAP